MLDAPHGGGYRSPMRPAPAFPEIAVVDLQVCDRCGLCLPLCPPEAIHLALTDLVVDRSTCTGCRKYIAPCPVGALTILPARPTTPMCWPLARARRTRSRRGGGSAPNTSSTGCGSIAPTL